MDKIKSAAIIMLGLGENVAADILRSMSPKEIKSILDAVDSIGSITETDLHNAVKSIMSEINGGPNIDATSKEKLKNLIRENMTSENIFQSADADNTAWLEQLKMQPAEKIVAIIQDEHPQIITAIVIFCFNHINSEYGKKVLASLPVATQTEVIKRMTTINALSKSALNALSKLFKSAFQDPESNGDFSLDGIDALANIISSLDSESEHKIVNLLTSKNKALGDKLQDRIFPFHRLADLDKKSLQLLLAEISSDDLVLALKGVSEAVKAIFFANMSSKAAEILKDDMEAKGPVKLSHVQDAQKRIIKIAKKLDQEEKIILTGKSNPNVVY